MRMIRKRVEVEAAPAAVWEAWATAAGAVTFFAPEAHIGGGHAGRGRGEADPPSAAPADALRPGDPYELYFLGEDEAPEGGRGSDGCRVLAQVPGELLAFDWNAPPRYPGARAAARRAWVVVEFRAAGSTSGGPLDADEAAAARTLVRLTHLGFGEGEEWDAVFAYFERAWGTVLRRLEQRFVSGPIDWASPDG